MVRRMSAAATQQVNRELRKARSHGVMVAVPDGRGRYRGDGRPFGTGEPDICRTVDSCVPVACTSAQHNPLVKPHRVIREKPAEPMPGRM